MYANVHLQYNMVIWYSYPKRYTDSFRFCVTLSDIHIKQPHGSTNKIANASFLYKSEYL